MKTIREMREKRQNLLEQMQDLHNQADVINGIKTLSKDQNEQYERMDGDYKSLDSEIRRSEDLEARLAASSAENGNTPQNTPEGQISNPKSLKGEELVAARSAAFEKYFRFGLGACSEQERGLLQVEGRVQSGATNAAGAYLIPEGHSRQIEKSLKDYVAMANVARIMRTSSGNPFPWPTNDDTANKGRLIAEATGDASAGTTDLVFGIKQLDAFKYTSDLIKVSTELLEDEETDLVQYLSEALGERLGRIMNEHTTTGSGSGEPNGVVTASPLGKLAASATVIDRGEIVDLIHSIDPAYRRSPSFGLMFNDATLAAIRKLSFGTADDRPLYQVSAIAGEPATVEGEKFVINQDMASVAINAKYMLAGDFNKYIIRIVRDIVLKRADERYIENDVVAWVAFNRFDGELINTAAVKHLQGAAA